MLKRFWTSTTQLVAIQVAVIFLVTILVLSGVHRSTVDLINEQLAPAIRTEVQGLSQISRLNGVHDIGRRIVYRLASTPSRENVYLVVAADGEPLYGNVDAWPGGLAAAPMTLTAPSAPSSSEPLQEVRLFRTDVQRWAKVLVLTRQLDDGERLLVGRDARAGLKSGDAMGRALLTALVLTVGAGMLLAWGLSRLILRRVDEVATTARTIAAGDLTSRVPDRGSGDEFDRLAGTLNAMLGRIEALVTNLRMATDSLAHDLRSPLTRLSNHIHKAMAGQNGALASDQQAHLALALAESEQIQKILGSLLNIARAEAGVGRDQFAPLDLAGLAGTAVDLFEPAAEDAGIVLSLQAPTAVPMTAHSHLLFLALSNLLENALKFAPHGSEVVVSVTATAGGAVLSVADQGPGVPAADRARIAERFVRLDAGRGGSGAGLGLALVGAIARLHGASMELADNDPGLIVTLRFGPHGADVGRTPPVAS